MDFWTSVGLFFWGIFKRAYYWAPPILLDPFDLHQKYKNYLPEWVDNMMKALSGWSLTLFIILLVLAAILTYHELREETLALRPKLEIYLETKKVVIENMTGEDWARLKDRVVKGLSYSITVKNMGKTAEDIDILLRNIIFSRDTEEILGVTDIRTIRLDRLHHLREHTFDFFKTYFHLKENCEGSGYDCVSKVESKIEENMLGDHVFDRGIYRFEIIASSKDSKSSCKRIEVEINEIGDVQRIRDLGYCL